MTIQLDWYEQKNVTTDDNSDRKNSIKKNSSGSASVWWLRSANSHDLNSFFKVESSGDVGAIIAYATNGVSPAFRLG